MQERFAFLQRILRAAQAVSVVCFAPAQAACGAGKSAPAQGLGLS
jgi:hypothetical protein